MCETCHTPPEWDCGHTVEPGCKVCSRCLLEWVESRYSGATEIPERIGEYRILEHIGGGGMGDVYRAQQPNTDRNVALKTIRTGLVADDAVRRRFRDEDSNLKIAISAPVFDDEGRRLGVLVAGHSTAVTYGSLLSGPQYETGQYTDVLGPREPEGESEAPYIMVIHNSLDTPGAEHKVDASITARLIQSFDAGEPGAQLEEPGPYSVPLQVRDYRDQLSHERWLAAFAPVGKTRLVVAVRTPHGHIRDESTRLAPHLSIQNLSLLALLSLIVGFGLRLGFAVAMRLSS